MRLSYYQSLKRTLYPILLALVLSLGLASSLSYMSAAEAAPVAAPAGESTSRQTASHVPAAPRTSGGPRTPAGQTVRRVVTTEEQRTFSAPALVPPAAHSTCYSQLASNTTITYTSLQAAVDAAPTGDTVKISGHCTTLQTRGGSTQIAYITKTLTLRGGYARGFATHAPDTYPTLLDGTGQGRVLVISGTISNTIAVTIEDLNLTGGNASAAAMDGNGGAIRALNSAVTLRNSTVYQNQGVEGAALYLQDSTATLTGGTLRHNSASRGGAIRASDSTISASGTLLHDNSASDKGGALYLDGGSAMLDAVTLQNNSATAEGGALYAANGASITLQNSSQVTSNESAQGGGALYGHQSSFTITGSTVISSNRVITGSGGALYLDGGSATLDAVTLQSNSASADGGALYAANSASITLQNSSQVTGNQAAQGGVLFGSSSTFTVTTATLQSNSASSKGGALYLDGGSATLDNVTLQSNSASADGGALYAANSASITLQNSNQVTGNQAARGGVLFGNSSTLTVTAATLQSNSVSSKGGALYLDGGSAMLDAVTLQNNSATAEGGALYAANGASITLQNSSQVTSNESAQGGGALYGHQSSFTITGSTVISSNRVITGSGGALYLDGGSATLDNVTLQSNSASADGGALYAANSASITLQNSSQVTGNQAAQGGVLFGSSSTFTVTTATLQSNSASDKGGALYLDGGSATLDNVTLQSNSTSSAGGAIYANNSADVTLRNGSQVTSNESSRGGGGALYGHQSSFTITGSTVISSNRVITGSGGALYLDGGSATLDAVTLQNNSASNQGGALYAIDGESSVRNSLIEANSSVRGGGFYLQGGSTSLSANQIRENSTSGAGAGLYITGTTTSLISNTISGNVIDFQRYVEIKGYLTETIVITYTNPDKVYPAGSPVTATVVISDNGGGLYMASAQGTLIANEFTHNQASANGGGLYLVGSSVTLQNNLIARNRIFRTGPVTESVDIYLGSGLYTSGSAVTVTHSTVVDNYNLEGTNVLTNSSAIYVHRDRGRLTLLNNIIAHHHIGVHFDPGNRGVADGNVWWENGVRHFTRDIFDDFAVHHFGDPAFIDRANEDYHIGRGSAAFDAGIPIDGLASDIEGTPRSIAFGSDAGAYEHRYSQGLYIEQESSETIVARGGTVTRTVRLANHSLAPVTNVLFSDALPPEQSITGMRSTGGTASCTSNPCSVGTIAPGETVEIFLNISVNSGPLDDIKPLTNTVTINSPDLLVSSSDTTHAFVTYLQDVVMGSSGIAAAGEMAAASSDPTYTGQCRIQMLGVDYATLQAAFDNANRSTNLIRVSGNCAGKVHLSLNAEDALRDRFDVIIQGGWSTDMSALDPDLYATSLDGVRTGSTITIEGEFAPVIENLTIKGGQAPSGGGVLIQKGARPTLRNVDITDNRAINKGGGIYINQASLATIEKSKIRQNQANDSGAGGYLNANGSTIKETEISNNTSASDGGGLYLKKSEAKIMDSTIENHSVSGDGGGIYLDESPAMISGSTIRNNSARAGGGIFANKSNASILFNRIEKNRATGSPLIIFFIFINPGGGGGIYGQKSNLIIQQNTLVDNSAGGGDGGGIHMWDSGSGVNISGNVIANNTGHGVYLRLTPSIFKFYIILPPLLLPDWDFLTPVPLPAPITMNHNTVANNSGNGVHVFGRTNVRMLNNIITGNSTGVAAKTEIVPHLMFAIIPFPFGPVPIIVPIPTFYAPKIEMDYTLWGTGGQSISGESEPFMEFNPVLTPDSAPPNEDPAFVNPAARDYHIKRVSAAFFRGKNEAGALDIDGESRPQGNRVDVGADEYPFQQVRYVTPSGSSSGNCLNWKSPCSLQHALNVADEGDLIKVAGGTYNTVLADPSNSQRQVAYLDKTVTIQGGYYPADPAHATSGNLTGLTKNDWEHPYPDENPTILDAGGQGRGLFIEGDISPEILGIRVTGGNASAAGMDGWGGGVYVISATATISDVQVYGNSAVKGGGLFINQSSSIVENSIIRDNSATQGGAFYLLSSGAKLLSNTIEQNQASGDGGAFYVLKSTGEILGNIVQGNSASGLGGAFYLTESSTLVQSNPQITNNQADRGGAFYLGIGGAQILSNTIDSNLSTTLGGGLYLEQSEAQLVGNLVLSNTAPSGGGFYVLGSNDAIVKKNQVLENMATSYGGGFYLEASSTLLEGNVVANNQAQIGGGVALFNFSPATLLNNRIADNVAQSSGGGVYVRLSSSIQLENNTITGNQAASGGGLFFKLGGASSFYDTVEGNQATYGGAFYLDESLLEINSATVTGNQARDGAAFFILRTTSGSIENSSIEGNTASNQGGGIYLQYSSIRAANNSLTGNIANRGGGFLIHDSTPQIEANRIISNSADYGGGFYMYNESQGLLVNNAIVDNTSNLQGSGLYIEGASPVLLHNTLARNSGGDGSALYITSYGPTPGTVTLVNTILVNHAIGLFVDLGSSAHLDTTLLGMGDTANGIDYTGTGTVDSQNDIRANPALAPDGYHLTANSAAIDEAVPYADLTVEQDVDQDPRPNGATSDIGADEFVSQTCYARISNQPDALYRNLQEAVDNATDGATVKVAGNCRGVQARNGTQQVLFIDKDLTITGGYADTATGWEQPFPLTQTTRIDADKEGRGIYILGATVTIENVQVVQGNASGLGGGPAGIDSGGGLYIANSTVTLRNSNLMANTADFGAGLYLASGQLTVEGGSFDNNIARTNGGAAYLYDGSATILNGQIKGNRAIYGAGLYVRSDEVTVAGNSVEQNKGTYGGAFFLDSSTATIRENSILSNTARAGGGIYLDLSSATIRGNQIEGNLAESGGGIYVGLTDNAIIDRNRLKANVADGAGGGLILINSTFITGTLSANEIISNSANYGGGLYMESSTVTNAPNNLVGGNRAGTQGAGIYLLHSPIDLLHPTIAGNVGGDGSGIYATSYYFNPGSVASDVRVRNGIIANQAVGLFITLGNKATVETTLWHGNQKMSDGGGTVNRTADRTGDPRFINPAAVNYHLSPTSAAIDMGADVTLTTDVDGEPRPAGNGFDLGADEYYFPKARITVAASPNPAVSGYPLRYDIRVANIGNVSLNGTISVTLPSGVTTSEPTSWSNISIPRDSTWRQSLTVQVQSGYVEDIESKFGVRTREGATSYTSHRSQVVPPDPQMGLTVRTVPAVAVQGAPLRYEIEIQNSGNVPLHPTVDLALPAAVVPNEPLRWDSITIESGTTWQQSVNVTVNEDAPDPLIATVDVTSPEGPGAHETVTTTVSRPSLRLSQQANPHPAIAGAPLVYTLMVTNTGNIPLTADITQTLPPELTPSSESAWSSVLIGAGERWQQDVTVTVEEAYSGTLTTTLQVVTEEGPSARHSAAIPAQLPLKPTIYSVRSGNWGDPSSWNLKRVPNETDIVYNPEGNIMTVADPIRVRGLLNYGAITRPAAGSIILVTGTLYNLGEITGGHGVPCQAGSSIELELTRLENKGLIRGGDGGDCPSGEGGAGGSILIRGENAEFINTGEIRGGDGGDGLIKGGNGGPVAVAARQISHDSLIQAGHGGNVIGTGNGLGGDGGDATILGENGGPAKVEISGEVRSGDGGKSNAASAAPQSGGNGGDVEIMGAPELLLDGAQIEAGKGSAGRNGGSAGTEGDVSISGGDTNSATSSTISLSDPETRIRGGEIKIFAGVSALVDLRGMSPDAIVGSRSIIIATGENSTVNMSGNIHQIIRSSGQVLFASNGLVLPSGKQLSDVAGPTATTSTARLLFGGSVLGPTRVTAKAGAPVPIDLTIVNRSPAWDSFTLRITDSAGWTLGSFPDNVSFQDDKFYDRALSVTPPRTAIPGDFTIVEVTARSTTDPTQVATAWIWVVVGDGTAVRLYLPTTSR